MKLLTGARLIAVLAGLSLAGQFDRAVLFAPTGRFLALSPPAQSLSLCADMLMLPALAQEVKEEKKEEKKLELPPCLADIAGAKVVEDARLRSVALRESLIAAQKMGPQARDMLIEMVHVATPAGKVLSLALLKKIDAAEYRKQADALKQEGGNQSVSYISPSERCHYNVSDIIGDQDSKAPLIRLLPDATAK